MQGPGRFQAFGPAGCSAVVVRERRDFATILPAARCAAIKRQCGGKFDANACGDRLLSAN
ncbi:MAG TPA: hypothetical protein DEH75_32275 [Bradyrhizobium sp.]|nr:hypothetical protein [Bradyrhizobium sp.]HAR12118.1 hypothetical protein [Bradyrhizobium sp.]HAR26296.1 hypothetical protein [Bradyrhizobium sp.]HBY31168.1 hypothetical protein [Bradyrhizobium sp.]